MAGVAIDTFVTSTGETGADAAGAANSAAGTVVATSDVGGTELPSGCGLHHELANHVGPSDPCCGRVGVAHLPRLVAID